MRKARRYYELPYFIKSWRNILSARAGFFTLILLALFPLFCAEASDSLVLRDGKETYSLGPYLEILEDKQGKWRIDDVTTPEISKKFLRDGRETPHLGMTDSVFWIRFTIEDRTSGRKQWLLELDFPHMDYIDLYLPRSDGAFEIKQAGDMRPMRVREIAHRNPVFLLPVSSPKATFYLRADAKGVTMFPLYIRTYRAFLETDYLEAMAPRPLFRVPVGHGWV